MQGIWPFAQFAHPSSFLSHLSFRRRQEMQAPAGGLVWPLRKAEDRSASADI